MLSPAQKALIELLARRLIRDAIAGRLAAAQASAQNRALQDSKHAS
jgi:hypothetical protein